VTTPFGLYEFPVMCFVLKNAAQTFQRLNKILRGLAFVFAYIDDVLIASHSESEHETHLCSVLERFQKYGGQSTDQDVMFSFLVDLYL
jgi:hypothetical protein